MCLKKTPLLESHCILLILMDINWKYILVILKQEFVLKNLILVIGKMYNGLYKS